MALGGFFSAFRWGEVYPKAVVRFPRFLSHFLSSCNSNLAIFADTKIVFFVDTMACNVVLMRLLSFYDRRKIPLLSYHGA